MSSLQNNNHPSGSGHESDVSKHKLVVIALVNGLGFLFELIGGLLFGSVALMGDSIHMLFDTSAYGTASLATHIAETREGSEFWTFGFHRIEVITAILNGVFLFPMAGWIVWEAYRRFLNPTLIDVGLTLIIAIGGLVVNVVSVLYIRGEEMTLNERSAFYHLLGDVGGSLAVILGVSIFYYTGLEYADPVAAIFIAGLVVFSAGKVLFEGTNILLQKSPIPPSDIKNQIERIEGVKSAHSIKCWNVCSSIGVCSLHVIVKVETLKEAESAREKVVELLRDKFGFKHVTVQIEVLSVSRL